MKKTLLTLVAVTITCATLICSCEKCGWDDGLGAYDMATTDCHTAIVEDGHNLTVTTKPFRLKAKTLP